MGGFMSKLKKIIIASVLFLIVGIGIVFGIKFYLIEKIDDQFYKYETAYIELEKLDLDKVQVKGDKHTAIETDQIKYIIPIENGKVEKKSTSSGEIAKASFDDDKYVINTNVSEFFTEDWASTLDSSTRKQAKKVFGSDLYSSGYEFLKTFYSYTPNKLSLTSSFADITTCKIALTCKTLLVPGKPKKIYYFESKNLKGFMHSGDSDINLLVFPDDNTSCTILIKNLTEDDAKQILASIEFK